MPEQVDAEDVEGQLFEVACHEAGHAVVSVLVRWSLRCVSIVPDEDTPGRTMSGPLPPSMRNVNAEMTPSLRGLIKRCVKVCLAGGKAARLLTGRSGRANEEQLYAWGLALRVAGGKAEEAGAYLCQLHVEVEQQLQQPRVLAAVKAVAAALLEKRCLGGKEVRAIVERHRREVGR